MSLLDGGSDLTSVLWAITVICFQFSLHTHCSGVSQRLGLYLYREFEILLFLISPSWGPPLHSRNPGCHGSFTWSCGRKMMDLLSEWSHPPPVLLQLWSLSGQSYNTQEAHSLLVTCSKFYSPQNRPAFVRSSEFPDNFLLYFPSGFMLLFGLVSIYSSIAEAELLLVLGKAKGVKFMREFSLGQVQHRLFLVIIIFQQWFLNSIYGKACLFWAEAGGRSHCISEGVFPAPWVLTLIAHRGLC